MLKLKKLQILGFKSFCDRTELKFHGDGIAAIIGPNDFTPPMARMGIESRPRARNALLSTASWSNALNCSNAECIAPSRA